MKVSAWLPRVLAGLFGTVAFGFIALLFSLILVFTCLAQVMNPSHEIQAGALQWQDGVLLAGLAMMLWMTVWSNAALLFLTKKNGHSWRKMLPLLGNLNSVALIVTTFWSIITAPLLWELVSHFSRMFQYAPNVQAMCFELFAWTIAVGSMISPLPTAIWQRVLLNQAVPKSDGRPWWSLGTVCSIVAMVVLVISLPQRLTAEAASAAVPGPTLKPSLLLLRAIGDEMTLRRACYRDVSFVTWNGFHNSIGADKIARELYYRVIGKPFNGAPKPVRSMINQFGLVEDDYEDYGYDGYFYGDTDFAGASVGGVLRGLELSKSSMSGWVDADRGMARLDWGMDFTNKSYEGRRELRTQILLPPSAVVTGCSLFVNGVRHEAVMAQKDEARKAYVDSANNGERPLLVSTAGPGRVLLQSSVGWWGPEAHLDVQIATPLVMRDDKTAYLPLPAFAERNFAVKTRHDVSLQTPSSLGAGDKSVSLLKSGDKSFATGSLADGDLGTASGVIPFVRKGPAPRFESKLEIEPGQRLIATMEKVRAGSNGPVAIILDGSESMNASHDQVCDALIGMRAKHATLIWASDEPGVLLNDADTASSSWNAAVKRLRDAGCVGGQDNAASLRRAIELVGNAGGSIVWIHGPQPVKFGGDDLLNLLRRNPNAKLYEYQLVTGPNVVVNSLDRCQSFFSVPRIKPLKEDLAFLFDQATGICDGYQLLSSVTNAAAVIDERPADAASAEKICTADWIKSQLYLRDKYPVLTELAMQEGIVTPLTNALVLEKEDYDHYGVRVAKKESHNGTVLKQLNALNKFSSTSTTAKESVSAKSKPSPNPMYSLSGDDGVPVKPEPETRWLILCMLPSMVGLVWIVRRRRAHS